MNKDSIETTEQLEQRSLDLDPRTVVDEENYTDKKKKAQIILLLLLLELVVVYLVG